MWIWDTFTIDHYSHQCNYWKNSVQNSMILLHSLNSTTCPGVTSHNFAIIFGTLPQQLPAEGARWGAESSRIRFSSPSNVNFPLNKKDADCRSLGTAPERRKSRTIPWRDLPLNDPKHQLKSLEENPNCPGTPGAGTGPNTPCIESQKWFDMQKVVMAVQAWAIQRQNPFCIA